MSTSVRRSAVGSASPLLFFKAPPPPEIYTLSLHDALPISYTVVARGDALILNRRRAADAVLSPAGPDAFVADTLRLSLDRKSTRLNSSHVASSYAVFCLKKKGRLAHGRQRSRCERRRRRAC